MLRNCRLCPRACGIDRTAGKTGFCRAPLKPKVARAALHFWEEPCLSGDQGSGAVFFSHCNLKCVFCQNYEIACVPTFMPRKPLCPFTTRRVHLRLSCLKQFPCLILGLFSLFK